MINLIPAVKRQHNQNRNKEDNKPVANINSMSNNENESPETPINSRKSNSSRRRTSKVPRSKTPRRSRRRGVKLQEGQSKTPRGPGSRTSKTTKF